MLRQRFTYFEGQCASHGVVRAALPGAEAVIAHPCPRCGRAVRLYALGCTGTVRFEPRLVHERRFNRYALNLPTRVTPTTRAEYRLWILRLRDEMGDDL